MSIFLQDIRASYDSRHFGASLTEGAITVWKSSSPSPITTVKPGFTGGSQRHFIDPVNGLIYVGNWEAGLNCFDFVANRLDWHRGDLIGIQTVNLSAGFPSSLFVTLAAPDYRIDEPGIMSGIVELNAQDGSTKWLTQDGDWLFVDPRRPLLVIRDECNRVVRILDGDKNEIGSTPIVHFAINDVAFGEGMIALAEGEKGVRILDNCGDLISHYAPQDRKPNCIKVTFTEDRVVVFDSWDGSFITIIDPHTGKLISEYERESHADVCFIDDGSHFVDSSGRIFRSSDGHFEAMVQGEPSDAG